MKLIKIKNQFFRLKDEEGIKFCVDCKTDYNLNVLSLNYIPVSNTKKLPTNWRTARAKTISGQDIKKIVPIIINDISLGFGSPYMPGATACNVLNTVVPDSMSSDIQEALKCLNDSVKKDITGFVCERLQYSREEICEYLAAEQIDAVALAIYNIEVKGQGFIIGDQTGIGKGRMAAAIIRYGIIRGKKPIFITEKVNLFTDMYRDLSAIGSAHYVPFIVNSNNSDTKVKDSNGNVVYEAPAKNIQDKILNSGKIPDSYNYIMATYSQFRSEKNTIKQNFLLKNSGNNIFILDESHNAGGNPDVSNTARFFMSALSNASGVCYLSATFAKRPDNMPLYAMKTCIGDSNLDNEGLISAIQQGGVALQEIISSNIVHEGQMIRRERSFEDVEVNYITLDKENSKKYGIVDKEQEHKLISDSITTIMRDIIAFEEEYINDMIDKKDNEALLINGGEAEKTKGTKNAGIDNTPYFSKVFNVINQVLFSIKAEDVANRAIQRLKEGKKPVLAFSSTMGALLENTNNDRGMLVCDGDIIKADYAGSLMNGLNSTLKYSIIDEKGQSEKRKFELDELSESARIEFKRISAKISKTSTGITISPIDVMKHLITEAGFTVAEVTGRKLELEFAGNNLTQGIVRNRKKENATDAFRKFQNNEVDCLFINQSGSTGASAHAVITDKVDAEHVKPRVMIIAQPELNINTEVQKRGRINRTGQIYQPIYDYINSSIPAEKRLMMMLQKKLKSLDANTTSNQKQSTKILDTSDFLNKYGDKVVIDYLVENPEINDIIGDPLKLTDISDKTSLFKEGAAHTVSGRVAILSCKEQERFYDTILERYSDYVNYLIQCDEYDLEVETMQLDAELQEQTVLIAGKGGDSVFGGDTYRGKYLCNVLKKPFKKSEIEVMIAERLNGYDAETINNNIISKYQEYIIEKAESEKADILQKLENSIEQIQSNTRFEKKLSKLHGAEKTAEIENIKQQLTSIAEDSIKSNMLRYKNEFRNISSLISYFTIGKEVSFNILSTDTSTIPKAVCLGISIKENDPKPFLLSKIKVCFAVSDSTKYFELNMASEQRSKLEQIRGSYLPQWEHVLDNWDEITKNSNVNRKIRYIVTGNILQASGNVKGKLISFTKSDGTEDKGILLPDNIDISKNGLNKSVFPISKCFNVIKSLGDGSTIPMSNGLSIQKTYRGFKLYTDSVSISKFGNIVKNQEIIDLCQSNEGFEKRGSSWVALIEPDNIEKLIQLLSLLNVSCILTPGVVEAYHLESDASAVIVNKRSWKKINFDSDNIPSYKKPNKNASKNIAIIKAKAKAIKLKLKLLELQK